MTLLPIKLPAGFYRNGTDYEQSNRWRDGSLVRWRDGSLRPVGGWRDRVIGQTEYGKQAICNETFIMDAVWDLQAGWSISSNQASYDQLVLTFDASDSAVVDYTTDTITINAHNLDNGDIVRYVHPSQPAYAIGGLVSSYSYYVVNATTNTFQLSSTSGGSAINLTDPLSLTFDANDLAVFDAANDKIIAANTFADGDQVTYTNGGGEDIGGLTNNSQYYIVSSSATEFKVSATSGGTAIDLTAALNVDFDGDDAAVVDTVNDKIIVSNTFTDGDEVTYTADLAAIDGLTDGANYFIINATASEFQLSATSGGAAIALTANYELTVDATDAAIVDTANDKFVIANTFTSGDKVTYDVNGGTAIAGLTDGTEYFVINASATDFALSATAGGTAIDLTAVGVGTTHKFRLDIGSTHNLRKDIGDSHKFERDIQAGHTFTCLSAKSLAQTILAADIVGDHKYHLEIDIEANTGTGFYIISNYFNTVTVAGNDTTTQYVNFTTPTTPTNLELEIKPLSTSNDITLNSVRMRKVNSPRAMHAWESLDGSAWIATGSYSNLYATTSGGLTYDITPYNLTEGIEDAQLGSGYGSGFYGFGGYGQPRQNLGVYSEATTWSLDNFGEVLVACSYDDGKLYDWTLGTSNGSELVTNGDFASASGWTYKPNWSFGTGAAKHAAKQYTFDATDVAVVDDTTDIITITGHGLSDGDRVKYTVTTGETDIAGLTSGTTYYVVSATANTFKLAATSGGTAIDITAQGTGTTDTFDYMDAGALEQVVTTTAEKVYILKIRFTPVDGATMPDATLTLTGDNTSTTLLTYDLCAGDHTFRIDVDDTSCTLAITPATYNEEEFTVDNIELYEIVTAEPIANAPTDNLGLVVTEERFIVALGAGGNPRKVQWCDFEDRTLWAPSTTNQAGSQELQTTGQIMQAVRTRGQTLVITDVDAHAMRYSGPPYIYNISRVGTACGAVSRKAAVDVDMGIFWMGQGGFYRFDGNAVAEIPCEVRDYIFEDFNTGQQSKIWAYANSEFAEIWWYYPSSGSSEIDRYVGYNYRENFWIIGEMSRTCGASRGVFRYPILGDSYGTLYDHEVGVNKDGLEVYAETGPISLGNGDQTMQVMQVIPDEKTQGDVEMFFKTRFHPNDVERTYGPFTPANPTSARFQGRQIRMRVEEDQLTPWRVGVMRLDVVARGRR